MPILIAGLGHSAARCEKTFEPCYNTFRLQRALPAVILAGVLINLPITHYARRDSLKAKLKYAEISRVLTESIPQTEALLCANTGVEAYAPALAYYLAPRLIGSFAREQTNPRQFELMRTKLNTHWLVDFSTSEIAAHANAASYIAALPPPFENCALWRLKDDNPSLQRDYK